MIETPPVERDVKQPHPSTAGWIRFLFGVHDRAALGRVFREHVWHSDRPVDEQRAFRELVVTVTRRFVRIAAILIIPIAIVTWPLDRVTFAGRSPALLWYIIEWRLAVLGGSLGILGGLFLLPRYPFQVMVVVAYAMLACLGVSTGKIGALDTNFLYSFYVMPFFAILVAVPIIKRIAFTTFISVFGIGAYVVTYPKFLAYPYLSTTLAMLAMATIQSVFIGHVFYDLVRVSYFRGRDLERERERSERLIQNELQRQVAERSRELGTALAKLASQPPSEIGAGRTIDGRYQVIRRLGAGGMGIVHEVERNSDGKHFALKSLRGRIDPSLMSRFAREAEIAARLNHPNLVAVVDVGVADGALFLVMELIEGGSLEAERARFGDASWAIGILAQIACGLVAIHERGIVHRDLKPGNVLLAGGTARIADFGLASLHDDAVADTATSALAETPAPPLTHAGDVFGTLGYMAPELAAGAKDAKPSSDVFAFGVIAYEMLTGRAPFLEPPVQSRQQGKAIIGPSMDDGPHRAHVLRCLAIDPLERPTANELVAWTSRR